MPTYGTLYSHSELQQHARTSRAAMSFLLSVSMLVRPRITRHIARSVLLAPSRGRFNAPARRTFKAPVVRKRTPKQILPEAAGRLPQQAFTAAKSMIAQEIWPQLALIDDISADRFLQALQQVRLLDVLCLGRYLLLKYDVDYRFI